MARNFGLALIALVAGLIISSSPATAQTHNGGKSGGRAYSNPTPPQQEYQGWQTPQGSGSYGYSQGNSYAAPGYGSYEPRYDAWHGRRAWRERMWRERMWRERNRYRGRWGW
jgi:hypothetical protein